MNPTTQPWEKAFRETLTCNGWYDYEGSYDDVMEEVRKLITSTRLSAYHEGFDAGGHTVGGTGRIMYENGYAEGKTDALKKVLESLDVLEYPNTAIVEVNGIDVTHYENQGFHKYRLAAREIIKKLIEE